MKVPIEVETDEVREDEEANLNQAETADEEEAVVVEDATIEDDDPLGELSPEEEAEMVEAAKRAGAEAAEREIAADADRAREEHAGFATQVDELTDELAAAKKQAAEANERLLRLKADWENYRRRTAAERLAERERAAERVVTNLLPVLDDMERASAHARQTAGDDERVMQFVEGVDAVHAKMLDILSRESVEVIDPVGEPFDPLVHQAVGRVEDHEAYDETVAQVYQRGYRMGDKVIRAAMVTVSFGGPKRPVEEE